MTIFFVSLISRDNRPLYIQPFSPYEKQLDQTSSSSTTTNNNELTSDEISFVEERNVNELLKYNFLSHMSLDIFESPFTPTITTASTIPTSTNNNTATGTIVGLNSIHKIYNLLFVQDGIFIFGYETNTGLKIVVGASRKENELEMNNQDGLNRIFREIHKAYLSLICNPFKNIDSGNDEIVNSVFDKKIKKIVDTWNSSH
ncbi:hypothetical protein CANARDRAFT_22648 [[Candida] arabinofermentans NRRL YB-2248]|uniref:Trafficking protein particle complex subunit n=1 Tax=[Candida] arabinofermentans NRRL YB-2248 TaxID=983967 RepID=A0A1E4T2B7_9ASCO|nr:hypothetical protein CANARDRAFT_22648 [[Candida] arabinofermentans NRRL YB-2248]